MIIDEVQDMKELLQTVDAPGGGPGHYAVHDRGRRQTDAVRLRSRRSGAPVLFGRPESPLSARQRLDVKLHTTFRCPPKLAAFVSAACETEFESALSDAGASVQVHRIPGESGRHHSQSNRGLLARQRARKVRRPGAIQETTTRFAQPSTSCPGRACQSTYTALTVRPARPQGKAAGRDVALG